MAIYLKLEGIDGEVTAKGFEKQIEATSLQFGAGVGVGSPTGGGGKRTASNPSISEITISKAYDNASGLIFKQLCSGTPVPKGTISFVRSQQGENTVYLTISLEDIFFSGQSISSGGDQPSESVSLNFAKIKFDNKTNDSEGKPAQGSIAGWDLVANTDWA